MYSNDMKSTQSKLDYMKAYREKRKHNIASLNKEYRVKNREKLLEYSKKYYSDNKNVAKEYKKKKYDENRDSEIIKRKKWYLNNKDKHADARRKYESENKQRLLFARRKWEQERMKNDPNYSLRKSLRSRIRLSLKFGYYKKDKKTEELIGCTIEQFRDYIESLFTPGMSWNNWCAKGWHIDHKIPLSWFNLDNENCRKLAFHYSNMQPLWAKDNFIKSNKYSDKI